MGRISKPKVVLVLGLIGLGFIFAGLIEWQVSQNCSLRVGSSCFRVTTVSTPEARAQGLSGHDRLPNNRAMLFEFKKMGNHCMWMKDMRFSIDMIWLSPEKYVDHIEYDVSPQTYPKSFCSPEDDSAYVIEMAAGQAKASGIKVGDAVSF